jgi:phage gp37-like protein
MECSQTPQVRLELSRLGVVTLTAAGRITADLVAGQAQAAMLAADFHSAMALRRCRRVAGAERRERGGTKRLRTAENTLTNRCRSLGDRKPCIPRSRRRNGRCEFSDEVFGLPDG